MKPSIHLAKNSRVHDKFCELVTRAVQKELPSFFIPTALMLKDYIVEKGWRRFGARTMALGFEDRENSLAPVRKIVSPVRKTPCACTQNVLDLTQNQAGKIGLTVRFPCR